MKSINYILILLSVLFCISCETQDLMMYEGVDRLHFADTTDYQHTFVWEPETVTTDTIFLTLHTMGDVYDYDRLVNLVQIFDTEWSFEFDENGVKVDSTYEEMPYQAEAGIHFEQLPEQTTFKVNANSVYVKVPIVLYRDATLKEQTYRLTLKVEANEFFQEGVRPALTKTIKIADQLIRPNNWDDVIVKYLFGEYGQVKHRFIIDVLEMRIDDAFFDTLDGDISLLNYYNTIVRKALDEYNQINWRNPLREEPQPGHIEGTLVTFPEGV